jgi:hypothetical protein
MLGYEGDIVIGVLGQWASGKTVAAKALISHLGGGSQVVFITDRALFAGQATRYMLELDEAELKVTLEDDGRRRFDGEVASVWLRPGEDMVSVDLTRLRFRVDDDVIPEWQRRARAELGREICKWSGCGKPLVIEASFGPDYEAPGHEPLKLSISDLFASFEEAGVPASLVKWLVVEAGQEIREARNRGRGAKVPLKLFARYAADGGDLEAQEQRRLAERGMQIRRVANDHDDIERFRADVIAAFQALFA